MKKILIFALSTLALAGCKKAPPPQVSEPPAQPVSTPIATTELHLFCRTNSIPQAVIDQFTKETGIQVAVENYALKEEMLARVLHSGRYDLIELGEDVMSAMVKDGLLRPIDSGKIPNLKNIDPRLLNRSFDPGNKFGVPFLASPVGILVNTEKISGEIRGLADVFAEKNRQNIVVLDDAREIVSLGFLARGIPINEVTDEHLKQVRPLLAKWLPLVKFYDSESLKLLNGEAGLGVIRGSEAAALLAKDQKFRWVVPAEGAHLSIDSLAILKGARNVANAMAFMNFLLRADIGRQLSDARPCLNPNLAARKLLSPEQLANPASFPTDKELAKMQTLEDAGEETSKIDEILTSLKVR